MGHCSRIGKRIEPLIEDSRSASLIGDTAMQSRLISSCATAVANRTSGVTHCRRDTHLDATWRQPP
jgi:hypothetical protein